MKTHKRHELYKGVDAGQMQAEFSHLLANMDSTTIYEVHHHRRNKECNPNRIKGHRLVHVECTHIPAGHAVGAITQTTIMTPAWPSDSNTKTPAGASFAVSVTIDDVSQDGGLGDCYFHTPLMMIAWGIAKAANWAVAITPQQVVVPIFDTNGKLVPDQVGVMFYRNLPFNAGAIATKVVVALAYDPNIQGPEDTKNSWGKSAELAWACYRTGADTFDSTNIGNPGDAAYALGIQVDPLPRPQVYQVDDPNKIYAAVMSDLKANTCLIYDTEPNTTNLLPGSHSLAVEPLALQPTDGVNISLNNPWGLGHGGGRVVVSAASLVTNGVFQAVAGLPYTAPVPIPVTPTPVNPMPTEVIPITSIVASRTDAVVGDTIVLTYSSMTAGQPTSQPMAIIGYGNVSTPSGTVLIKLTDPGAKKFTVFSLKQFPASPDDGWWGSSVVVNVTGTPAPAPSPLPPLPITTKKLLVSIDGAAAVPANTCVVSAAN